MMPPVKEPLAGLALLVIFGLLIWYNRPIESSRPFDPYIQQPAPRITGDTYESWLWKDPFGFDPAAGSGGAFEAWDRAVKKEDPDKKAGHRVREMRDPACKKRLEEIIPSISGNGKPIILAPLVKVRPETLENKEIRTRQRYAVIAGLIESNYRPQEPGLLHFCSIQENTREYDMRWEHYRHESKGKPDIIVAWINSEILTAGSEFPNSDKSIAQRHHALEELLSSAKTIENKFYIFDLNNVLDRDRFEQTKEKIQCPCGSEVIELIKPAGMEGKEKQIPCSNDKYTDSNKRKAMAATGCKEPVQKPGAGPEEDEDKKPGSKGLAKELADEMELRCITDPSELIIVTEQGSANATELASILKKFLGASFEKRKSSKQESGKPKCNNASSATGIGEIRNVFYLKGSDGNPKKVGAGDKKDKNENQSSDKADHVSVIDLHQPPPLPIGPGQMDYFHRLAEEIRNVHDTVDFDKRDSGAKAVVILGSDFNDKLMIIEALREKMPHLLILTTDLDAQMLYPKHWRSTRNVVVASHFNLLLKGTLQTRFPPFRDSQQTNIFYRTLAIATGDAESIEESNITFPRIFEVGRNGFVRLEAAEKSASEKNKDLDYHPDDNSQKNTVNQLWLLLGIALSLISFHWAIRPKSGLLSLYLFAGMLIIFAAAFSLGTGTLWANASGEPLSFAAGISLWPTLFIQIIAALLAGAFFILTICELDDSFCRLSRRYFPGCLSRFSVCSMERMDERESWVCKVRNLRPWLGRQIMQRSLGGLPSLVLTVTIIVYAYNDVYPSILPFYACLIFLVIPPAFYLVISEYLDNVSIGRWVKKSGCQESKADKDGNSRTSCHILRRLYTALLNNRSVNPPDRANPESCLWCEYYDHGLLGHRVIRVVAMWLIFAIIETLLVYLLPPWPLPWRGISGPASWTGVLSFVVTMLLLFFILDAVRLNFYWIKKLRREHPLLKERTTQEDIEGYNDAARNCPAESLENIVSLVAERTGTVDKLIYYPMLCIILMLFAKITYFDNQDFPLSKGITFGAAISFLFLSGFMLRHEANELKLAIKKSLKNLGKNKKCTEKIINKTIERIDAIDEGAFQPMFEQPVMQALLIVLASVGLFAGEYLKLFG